MFSIPLSLLLLCQLLLTDTVHAAQQCRLQLHAKNSGGSVPPNASTPTATTPSGTDATTSVQLGASASPSSTPFQYGVTPIRGVNLLALLHISKIDNNRLTEAAGSSWSPGLPRASSTIPGTTQSLTNIPSVVCRILQQHSASCRTTGKQCAPPFLCRVLR